MANIIYSHSFVEFLKRSDCKLAKLLYSIDCKYDNWRTPDFNSLIVTDKEINYITFRKDGTISYLPAGKEHKLNDEGEWSKEGRQNGKPSKVIRKLLCDRVQKYFKDCDFECFCNEYKANFNDAGYTFKLLSNKEIPSVYEMQRSCGDGSLNNSCMNGDSEYLDLYKNCKALQILTLTDKDSKLCGRSLVWKISEDITLMDRIYVSRDFMFDMFLTYAKENKLWRKKDYKSYDSKRTFIDASGKEVDKRFDIYTSTDFNYYPYIDTFQYGDEGSLNNYNSGCYTYNNTDGSRDGEEREDVY